MTALKMLVLVGYCVVRPLYGVGQEVSRFLHRWGV